MNYRGNPQVPYETYDLTHSAPSAGAGVDSSVKTVAYARSTTVSCVAKSLTVRRGLCNSRNRSFRPPWSYRPASECVMPSHLSADRPAAQPPGRGSVDALISQTRRLKGDMDAVRQDTRPDGSDP